MLRLTVLTINGAATLKDLFVIKITVHPHNTGSAKSASPYLHDKSKSGKRIYMMDQD